MDRGNLASGDEIRIETSIGAGEGAERAGKGCGERPLITVIWIIGLT
jgi:hypothetical protein